MNNQEIAYIRPARLEDLDQFYLFSKEAGFGFTHLPQDKKLLEKWLLASEEAFRKKIEYPQHETYFFVLQVGEKAVGCSGIISRIAVSEPFFAYHLLKKTQESPFLQIKREVPVLHFIQARKKPTELCSLFLEAAFRQKNFGHLLSFSRFLFISSFRSRFAAGIVSELRGISDDKGQSPFWDAIGRHFFGMDFYAANTLRIFHPECVEELFPTHPIYPSLLPKDAQAVIGIPHPLTLPALHLLVKQGFSLSHYVDIFDAGPHVFAPTHKVAAIQNAKNGKIKEIKNLITETHYLISNGRLDFRACFASFEIDSNGDVILDALAAKTLEVEVGETVCYLWA